MKTETERNATLTIAEKVLAVLALLSPFFGIAAVVALLGGCAYRGGKVVDGTNLAIGITVPGTEWSINALDYVGGLRVAGQDSTHIVVTNAVEEDASYFGCVTIKRRSFMTADIEPLASTDINSKEN